MGWKSLSSPQFDNRMEEALFKADGCRIKAESVEGEKLDGYVFYFEPSWNSPDDKTGIGIKLDEPLDDADEVYLFADAIKSIEILDGTDKGFKAKRG